MPERTEILLGVSLGEIKAVLSTGGTSWYLERVVGFGCDEGSVDFGRDV